MKRSRLVAGLTDGDFATLNRGVRSFPKDVLDSSEMVYLARKEAAGHKQSSLSLAITPVYVGPGINCVLHCRNSKSFAAPISLCWAASLGSNAGTP